MRKRYYYILIILLSCIAIGAGIYLSNKESDPGYTALSQEVREMLNRKGWTYYKTLGIPGKTVLETWLISSNAKTTTAFWKENGEVKKETFEKTEGGYAVVGCQKENGDFFSVIFKKK